ncbi:MAG: tRNA (adenine(22)-N(1))-methyltransferase [Erysipelotrichaceae bacterium]
MLSKRLSEVAKFVDPNKVVYDVGSDHALLPCFLVASGISPRAYAVDNKEGPINKAIENIRRFNLEDKVIPILSSGIEDIKDDVNIITICGMGFYTVESILRDKDLSRYDKIIIQINKHTELLRKWISDSMYTIIDESIVLEEGKYYEIVVFNSKRTRALDELEIEYGPYLLNKKAETFKKYLEYREKKYQNIYEKTHTLASKEKIEEISGIIGKIFGGN